MLYYSLIVLVTLYLLIKLYVKVTYNFWANQPVFHYYNLMYWIQSNGILRDLPKITNYCNFIDIISKNYFDYNEDDITSIVTLINNTFQSNYGSLVSNFEFNKNHFIANFTGHLHKSYIAIYKQPVFSLTNQTNQTIENKSTIIGAITGKPISILLKKKHLKCYYVDFLCVDKNYKHKRIDFELLQTYEYFQGHDNKEFKVTLIKQKEKIAHIVPFVLYKSYVFNSAIMKPEFKGNYKILEISEINFSLLINFITINKKNFQCIVMVDEPNLLHLILQNVYKVYGLLDLTTNCLKACYIFKQNYIIFKVKELYKKEEKNIYSLALVASINNCLHTEFINGFLIVVSKKYYLEIDAISDNTIIIQYLLTNSFHPLTIATNAYYLYNYLSNSVASRKSLIII